MPQVKQAVTYFELRELLLPEALDFVRKHKPELPSAAIDTAVSACLLWAADPELARNTEDPWPSLPRLFAQMPDFVPGLLATLRAKWNRLHHSKAGSLLIFMARNPCVRVFDHQKKPRAQWELTDGEVCTAYQGATKRTVTIDDVVKARKTLLRRYRQIDRLRVGGNFC